MRLEIADPDPTLPIEDRYRDIPGVAKVQAETTMKSSLPGKKAMGPARNPALPAPLGRGISLSLFPSRDQIVKKRSPSDDVAIS